MGPKILGGLRIIHLATEAATVIQSADRGKYVFS
jgi:hypothetical protein